MVIARFTAGTEPGLQAVWQFSSSFLLNGQNLMRIGLLDEAGRSRPEPVIVVAGVLVHGDRSYRKIEKRLNEIVAENIPEVDREGLVISAKDLFHGGGYFDRRRWSVESRSKILASIAEIPKLFGLPIVFGHLNKAEYRASIADKIEAIPSKQREHTIDAAEHMCAFARAEIAIERQMHKFPKDEICILIAEDTDRVKKAVKEAHAILRSETEIAKSEFAKQRDLPLKRIVDTPHFASKSESKLLQISDMCAFLILRRLLRKQETQKFFEIISPQLFWRAADFGEPIESEKICGGELY